MDNKKTINRRSIGEGNISQRKDGTWTARLQLGLKPDGKPILKAFYGRTRREAVDKLDDYKALTKFGGEESDLPCFDKYIMNWLNHNKVNELKSLSFDRLESTIKNHIVPAIGHYKTSEISDSIIQRDLINKKTKTMSYSSIKKIHDALNACFKYAVARRDLRYNPMVTVSIPGRSKFENKTIEIFTEEEVMKIIEIANLKYRNGVLKYKNGWAIIFMIYTGIRLGEATALKWDDYNVTNNTITIKRNMAVVKNRTNKGSKYQLVEQDTVKTKNSDRSIPLPKRAVEALTHLKETSLNYIISTKEGKAVRPRCFQNMFDSMLSDAGLQHKGLHVTRHTFASLLFKMGADLKTVSELLGHADIRITSNTYIHLIKEQKQNVINLLDGLN